MTPHDDDVDRDAWLREALRHAPDAQLGPPPTVSDTILRAAQASARRAAPAVRKRPRWTQRLWMWMAQPAVGAGLATVMIGSVVGTMWWEGGPLPEPPARRVVADAPVTVAQAPRETAEAAAAPPVAPAPTAPTAASAPETRQRDAAAADEALRRRPLAARSERRSEAAAGAATGAQSPPAVAAAPPPATAPDAAANDTVAQAARTAEASPDAAATAPAAAPPPSPAAARGLAKSSAPLPPVANTFVAADSDLAAIARAFIAMRLAVSTETRRWTWRRGEAAAQPIGDALTAWLAELDAAAASRWHPSSPTDGPATTLQLLRDGRVVHTLRLGADELRWETTESQGGLPPARAATLAPERAQALRESLARIGR